MKSRPILFSTPMVRAILEGRKTQTRRVIKLSKVEGFDTHDMWHSAQQAKDGSWIFWSSENPPSPTPYEHGGFVCPHGQPGDQLWVKETRVAEIDATKSQIECGHFTYKADDKRGLWTHETGYKFLSAMFMPKWASRITLEIVNVRAERLQEISREDAMAEGMDSIWHWTPDRDPIYFSRGVLNPFVANFSVLWDSLNAKRGFGWDVNPWVWVIEFPKVKP